MMAMTTPNCELLKQAAGVAAGIRPRIMYLDAISRWLSALLARFVRARKRWSRTRPFGTFTEVARAFCPLSWRFHDCDHTICAVFRPAQLAFPPSLGARRTPPPPGPHSSITSLTRKMARRQKLKRCISSVRDLAGSPGRSDRGYE